MGAVDNWVQQIESDIIAQGLFREGEAILLAVSGGLDSMVMLSALHELAPRYRWKLHVAHFNHQLRGRSSDADERFVVKIAEKLGVPVTTGRREVRQFALQQGISVEMAARELRHAFFAAIAQQLGIRKVALAHHADDQVELFFLRLQRGSGVLSGMKWEGPSAVDKELTVVRPLLNQTRDSLERLASARGIKFREDATNASIDIARNRIRHQIVPILKQQSPPIFETLLRSMEIAGGESDFLAEVANQWRRDPKGPFSSLHVALQRRILYDQLRETGMPVDFGLVERLRKSPGTKISVREGVVVSRDAQGRILTGQVEKRFYCADSRTIQVESHGKCGFGALQLEWSIERKPLGRITRKAGEERFDADLVGPEMELRFWRPGDRFRPIGLNRPVKLQDLFVNAKVPASERIRKVIAVAQNGEIFWVEGLRISDDFKLSAKTLRQLKWSWKTG